MQPRPPKKTKKPPVKPVDLFEKQQKEFQVDPLES